MSFTQQHFVNYVSEKQYNKNYVKVTKILKNKYYQQQFWGSLCIYLQLFDVIIFLGILHNSGLYLFYGKSDFHYHSLLSLALY